MAFLSPERDLVLTQPLPGPYCQHNNTLFWSTKRSADTLDDRKRQWRSCRGPNRSSGWVYPVRMKQDSGQQLFLRWTPNRSEQLQRKAITVLGTSLAPNRVFMKWMRWLCSEAANLSKPLKWDKDRMRTSFRCVSAHSFMSLKTVWQ